MCLRVQVESIRVLAVGACEVVSRTHVAASLLRTGTKAFGLLIDTEARLHSRDCKTRAGKNVISVRKITQGADVFIESTAETSCEIRALLDSVRRGVESVLVWTVLSTNAVAGWVEDRYKRIP